MRGRGERWRTLRARTIELRTPPIARIAPDGVFDAFGWCASDELVWRMPEGGAIAPTRVTADNPPGMVFVMHAECTLLPSLPTELAALHATGMGLEEERCLAPWAIDDATDGLWAARARPRDVMWLAARDVASLFWGLHDWAHFHNHGPFEERAWTELQCDAAALAWSWINRAAIGIDDAAWEEMRGDVAAIGAGRFAGEGKPCDAAWWSAARLRAIAEEAVARASRLAASR